MCTIECLIAAPQPNLKLVPSFARLIFGREIYGGFVQLHYNDSAAIIDKGKHTYYVSPPAFINQYQLPTTCTSIQIDGWEGTTGSFEQQVMPTLPLTV
jgi:hypothetical protein